MGGIFQRDDVVDDRNLFFRSSSDEKRFFKDAEKRIQEYAVRGDGGGVIGENPFVLELFTQNL